MNGRKFVKLSIFNLLACAAALAGACKSEGSQASAMRQELYLTPKFCLGFALDKGMDQKLQETATALKAEKDCGSALAEAKRLEASIKEGVDFDCAKVSGLIAFSLCFAPSGQEPAERKASGRQILQNVFALYCKTAGIQKSLDDVNVAMAATAREDLDSAAGKEQESERDEALEAIDALERKQLSLREDFDDARLNLVEAMGFHPVTDIMLDLGPLDAEAERPPENVWLLTAVPANEEELSKLLAVYGELKGLLPPSLELSSEQRKAWALLGLKAAKSLLEAQGSKPVAKETAVAARLACSMCAFASALDARAAFAEREKTKAAALEALTSAQAKGLAAGIALARAKAALAAAKRDEALASYVGALGRSWIAAIDAPEEFLAKDLRGQEKAEEPSDPVLIESPSAPGDQSQKQPPAPEPALTLPAR